MSSPQTVGHHMLMAIWSAGQAETIRGFPIGLASDDDEIARLEGAAAGHAFRAAELAYDLGQGHAIAAQSRQFNRLDIAVSRWRSRRRSEPANPVSHGRGTAHPGTCVSPATPPADMERCDCPPDSGMSGDGPDVCPYCRKLVPGAQPASASRYDYAGLSDEERLLEQQASSEQFVGRRAFIAALRAAARKLPLSGVEPGAILSALAEELEHAQRTPPETLTPTVGTEDSALIAERENPWDRFA